MASDASAPQVKINEVIVHPLVLLSVVDHYHRVAKDTQRRVVGVLLGETSQGKVDVSNSFAIPFDEDLKDPSIWYLDHEFLETMTRMFIKVNAKERVVGFYSTGPKLRSNDIDIDTVIRRHCKTPVLCIIDVRADAQGLPTQAYYSREEIDETTKETKRTFVHVPSSVGAYEAEEVGVEHLLRDINDPTVSRLSGRVKQRMSGLESLHERLIDMSTYLTKVLNGDMPANNQILYSMQDIVNLLPNLGVEELVQSILVKTNDMHLAIYIASLVRSIIALHNLLNNKIQMNESITGASSTPAASQTKEKASKEKETEKQSTNKST